MSADSTLVMWGVKFELCEADVELCERRADPRIVKARAASLDYYWGNFGGLAEHYLLFIGKKVAVIGLENSSYVWLRADQLLKSFQDTADRLTAAGFGEESGLHLVYHPDI